MVIRRDRRVNHRGLKDDRRRASLSGMRAAAVAPLAADAEAEVNERGEADEQADEAVHAFDGEGGEEAERALVRDRIAKEREQRRHGRRGTRKNVRLGRLRRMRGTGRTLKRAAVFGDRPPVGDSKSQDLRSETGDAYEAVSFRAHPPSPSLRKTGTVGGRHRTNHQISAIKTQ